MNTVTTSSAVRYLHEVHGKLQGLRQAKSLYESQLASRFNPIAMLKPWETDLSRVFADLLNPKGTHGQGDIFLKGFVEIFRLHPSWWVSHEVEVFTEVPTYQGRRIDIEVRFKVGRPGKPCLLGIENKPWAADQHEQVSHYIDDMSQRSDGNCLLLYLAGNGEGPSKHSLGDLQSDDPRLKVISYGQLVTWLHPCAQMTKAHRVRSFLEDLIKYIDTEFNGGADMDEREMIISDALQSPASLDAVFAISDARAEIQNQLLLKLNNDLKAVFFAQRPEWKIELANIKIDNSKGQDYSIYFNESSRYRVTYSFESNQCNSCIFGIAKNSDQVPDSPELREIMTKIMGPDKVSREWWPWYRQYEPANWSNDAQVWLQIQSGVLAQRIYKEVEAIYLTFEELGRLDAFR